MISPGVGAQGAGAKEAIEAGADYIIVGHRIYEAQDPGCEGDCERVGVGYGLCLIG